MEGFTGSKASLLTVPPNGPLMVQRLSPAITGRANRTRRRTRERRGFGRDMGRESTVAQPAARPAFYPVVMDGSFVRSAEAKHFALPWLRCPRPLFRCASMRSTTSASSARRWRGPARLRRFRGGGGWGWDGRGSDGDCGGGGGAAVPGTLPAPVAGSMAGRSGRGGGDRFRHDGDEGPAFGRSIHVGGGAAVLHQLFRAAGGGSGVDIRARPRGELFGDSGYMA